MRGLEIREHITTPASTASHPSLSSDSGHQGDEWYRLMANKHGESGEKREWPGSGPTDDPVEDGQPGRGRGRGLWSEWEEYGECGGGDKKSDNSLHLLNTSMPCPRYLGLNSNNRH